MKPHPSIFETALSTVGVAADEAMMVGDSLSHDVAGARQLGMRAVLLDRSGRLCTSQPDVPVIASLAELPAMIAER